MTGPFPGLSKRGRRRAIWGLLAAEVAQLGPLLSLERRMKRTGGPGIIPFELAGSAERSHQIMSTWGNEGQAAARMSLLLDYLFPATYAPLQALDSSPYNSPRTASPSPPPSSHYSKQSNSQS